MHTFKFATDSFATLLSFEVVPVALAASVAENLAVCPDHVEMPTLDVGATRPYVFWHAAYFCESFVSTFVTCITVSEMDGNYKNFRVISLVI